ncbi:hypothetical protein [Adhaeribacter radiodurans]|uniref:Uncharacterized protein n=1 Tax=Adhaeribacter radiodurans TaxID=2745197 RepID=A0A7L7LCK0_9BACT|nr:hypothetical protein [Adhaeribacter radiodurans]QMU30099.1 hypothetical protein HUW48_19620 [Adhaeribacter radiodurans]
MKLSNFYLLIIIFFIQESSSVLGQDKTNTQYKFYDFNISLELQHYPFPFIKKEDLAKVDKNKLGQDSGWLYVIQNEGRYYDEAADKQIDFEKNHLYVIQYVHLTDTNLPDSINIVKEIVDTKKIKLTPAQQDIIFGLTKNLFRLDDKPNISPDKTPSSPPVDGNVAIVNFDLNDRGSSYRIVISPKFLDNKEYLKLYKYLENLKTHPKTPPTR